MELWLGENISKQQQQQNNEMRIRTECIIEQEREMCCVEALVTSAFAITLVGCFLFFCFLLL